MDLLLQITFLVLVTVAGNRYVGDCCAGESMVGCLFPPGCYGSHEGMPRTPKRLANGALVKLGGLITHRVDYTDYRNHRKQAQNHICLRSGERLLGDKNDAPW